MGIRRLPTRLVPVLVLLSWSVAAAQEISALQFERMVLSTVEALEDVEFVYEGEWWTVIEGVETHDLRFQGVYAYRSDGATSNDFYSRHPSNMATFVRTTETLLRGEVERVLRRPDRDRAAPGVQRIPGGPGSFNSFTSPERFFLLWKLEQFSGKNAEPFEIEGWEVVDGIRCLRVRAQAEPGERTPMTPSTTFWFDVRDGVWPIVVEYRRGNELLARTHSIRFHQFTLPGGRRARLPVHGKTDGYLGKDGFTKEPVLRQVCYVVGGTLRLNQGLKDDRFRVSWKGNSPSSPELGKSRKEFEDYAVQSIRRAPRTDPELARKKLAEQLEEGRRQASDLEASSLARESWNQALVSSVVLVVVGLGLIGGGVVWRRKRP